VWVVEFATTEIRGDPTAAVKPHCPEVVGGKLLFPMDDRCNAVQIKILEAHCFLHVKACAIAEVHAACVHELLPLLARRVHRGVCIEILYVIERLHVVPEIHVTKDRCEKASHKQGESGKGIPHGIPVTLLRAICQKTTDEDTQKA